MECRLDDQWIKLILLAATYIIMYSFTNKCWDQYNAIAFACSTRLDMGMVHTLLQYTSKHHTSLVYLGSKLEWVQQAWFWSKPPRLWLVRGIQLLEYFWGVGHRAWPWLAAHVSRFPIGSWGFNMITIENTIFSI